MKKETKEIKVSSNTSKKVNFNNPKVQSRIKKVKEESQSLLSGSKVDFNKLSIRFEV